MTAAAILKLQRAGFTEEQVEALAEYLEQFQPLIPCARGQHSESVAVIPGCLELAILRWHLDAIKWLTMVGFAQAATILALLRLFPGHP